MNILIVEDHRAVREGVESYIAANLAFTANISIAENGIQALKILNNAIKIDVLITDLNMPLMDGFELLSHINRKFPDIKTMVFTMYYNSGILKKIESLNVNCLLSKNASLSEFKDAFIAIKKNESFKSSDAFKTLAAQNNELNILNDNFAKTFLITPRESDVLNCLIENMTNLEIGETLSLSPETIKGYRKNIYRKLGVNNVLDLYKLVLSTRYIKKG